MAIPYELIVKEDLDLGHGTVTRSMPGGGTATGNKIGLHTFFGEGWFNVKDFGAVADGVTDDAAAIQSVIDAALALPRGGVIFFPGGEYVLRSGLSIDLADHVPGAGTTWGTITVVGAGAHVTRLTYMPTTGTAIRFFNSDSQAYEYPSVRDLSIRRPANEANTATGLFFDGTSQQSGAGNVSNVQIGSFQVCLHVKWHTRGVFTGLKLNASQGAGGIGMKMQDNCNGNVIMGGFMISAQAAGGGTALEIDGVQNSVIGVVFETGEAGNIGIDLVAGGSNHLIEGCYFEGPLTAIRYACNGNVFLRNNMSLTGAGVDFLAAGSVDPILNLAWPRYNPNSGAVTGGVSSFGHVRELELASSQIVRSTVTGAWVDLDLTGSVAYSVRFAIAKVILAFTPAAAGDGVRVTFRAKGSAVTATDRLPGFAASANAAGSSLTYEGIVVIPLDSARTCQYTFDDIGTPSARDLIVTVIGTL